MCQAVIKNKIAESNAARNYFPIAAVGGVVAGLILMLTVLILPAFSYFERIRFEGLEMILTAAAFVFLGTGAHFLDLIDKEKKLKKIKDHQGFDF
jgi:hypothetical protein